MLVTEVINQLINGLMLSCIYALIGVGYSLFFGTLNVIHFAHGDVCIVGVYMTLFIYRIFIALGLAQGFPVWLTGVTIIILGFILTGFFGVLIERISIKPFRRAPVQIVLVATVFIGVIIRESIRNFYPAGANPQSFPQIISQSTLLEVVGTKINYENAIIFFGSIALISAIFLLIKKTRLGLSIRAISQDRNIALMMGINVDETIIWTFFIGSVLGAIAGIISALYFGATRFDLGLIFGIKGFSVAVIGGLGSVYGAVIGGLIFGLMETFAMAFIPQGTAWKEFLVFSVVILFLIFRPSGILGEKSFERV
jgi:branched-subunit amino acid ABC-type transport system permease component